MPPSIDTEYASRYAEKTPPWGFNDLGYVVYKRTYARPIFDGDEIVRTEEWWETIQRVINGAQAIGADLTQDEAERLFDYMFNLKGSVGGRMLWQLGTENNFRLGADSLVNCWYTELATPEDFGWLFERLMLGGGVGFSVDRTDRLGVVRPARVVHENANDADFIVPDKREGWSELVVRTLRAYLGDRRDLQEFTYGTQLVRPAGTPIKTFGGTASGPGILVEGIADICKVLDGAVNRNLSPTEVLDIANIIGRIVVSGNVRRSAQIALGQPHDPEYMAAKKWSDGDIPVWRAQSNNSVYIDPEHFDSLPDYFWDNYEVDEKGFGKSEPYGMFNLDTSQKFGRTGEEMPDWTISGTNPCAEIGLAHRESCNLSEIFLPNLESKAEFIDLAKILYKIQKAVAAMPYLDKTSSEITSRNMRLGLGLTGIAQAGEKLEWASEAYEALREFDAEWSAKKNYPQSVRLTTVKPSGTLSLLAGVTPGVHPGFSRYHLRRVRMAASDPLVNFVQARGYHTEPQRNTDGSEDPSTVVVEFPCEFPEDTLVAKDVDVFTQLDLVRRLQAEWADNAVSVTCYYKPEDLKGIQEYLSKHWHEMKSVSFLLLDDHGFDQAPLESIDYDTYIETKGRINHDIQLDLFGMSVLMDGEECVTGACPIR